VWRGKAKDRVKAGVFVDTPGSLLLFPLLEFEFEFDFRISTDRSTDNPLSAVSESTGTSTNPREIHRCSLVVAAAAAAAAAVVAITTIFNAVRTASHHRLDYPLWSMVPSLGFLLVEQMVAIAITVTAADKIKVQQRQQHVLACDLLSHHHWWRQQRTESQ
jgi:hypothetical protein